MACVGGGGGGGGVSTSLSMSLIKQPLYTALNFNTLVVFDHFVALDCMNNYLYNFESSECSDVYNKHTVGKDFKLKAGYDSVVRLGWASVWVGDEEDTTKTSPMKMKMQFMLQVPQDDVKSTTLIFRVKKIWNI